MAGQESRFNFINPQFAKNEEMTILQKVLSFIEKKLEVKGYVKKMTFRNHTVFCRCGNNIYKDGDSELKNIYKKNLNANAIDIFCRCCNEKLFFDTSQKAKQPMAPPPPLEKQPLIIEEVNQNTGNSMESEKPKKNQDKKGKQPNERSSFIPGTRILVVILMVFTLGFALKFWFFSPTPPAPRPPVGDFEIDPSIKYLIPPAIINISVSECLIEYAINKSDTSALITFVINQAINFKKINISDLGESYIVDELYKNHQIDLRDEKIYKDLIKCVIMKIINMK